MSKNTNPATKLTIADLDRFLDVHTDDAALAGYRQAAAVLSAFDPYQLKPKGGASSEQARERVLEELLPQSELKPQGIEGGLWSLTLPYRRETLREMATRDAMKKALAANVDRPSTPVQRMFERLLKSSVLELENLSREELVATLEVLDWVDGILDGLPEQSRVRQALTRVDLLAPMQRLAGHGFVGRQEELEQLAQYVSQKKRPTPLFVFGPGGVGKSTLLAKFVLTETKVKKVATAYVDIDRPVILPEKPLTILLEAVNQLKAQLEVPTRDVESLVKEITHAMSRSERTRMVESAFSGTDSSWVIEIFRERFDRWVNEKSVLVIVDTLEEAQYMGSDVMWPLIEFLIALNRSAPWCQVILSGRALPPEYVQLAFPDVARKPDENIEDPKFLAKIPLPVRPLNVSVLDETSAIKLLRSSLSDASADVSTAELKDIVGLVGGNPMVLKLAARLLDEEGVGKLRSERSELFARLKAEKIQALLYGRILRHLHDKDVRKVAYPGLIVRRITPEVIRDVLAKPCKLEFTPTRTEFHIFSSLGKEAALVYTDPEDGSLRHRADVRRAMLADLTDHVSASLVEEINQSAVKFYKKLPDAISRAEEIYHLLRLGESEKVLDSRWKNEAARHLQGALDEVPAHQRLWLADKLNVTLDKSVRETASQERWESQTVRSVDRYLSSRIPKKALEVLHERKTRLPRSDLYRLEAETYRFLGKYDEALAVARTGVDALTRAGAIDMALELLLKMVVIEEGQGKLVAAEKLLLEAARISVHSSNNVLQLRIKTTGLRLQRQLHPEAVEERQTLRDEASALLTDQMKNELKDHPVLLREVAAELSKQDPSLASLALESLGVEVATDAQAEALGDAIAKLNVEPKGKTPVTKIKGLKVAQQSKDPKEIRKWATQMLTDSDTRKLSKGLGNSKAGSDTLEGFRTYFRVGVDNALKGKL